MLEWLKRVFIGHAHVWEIHRDTTLTTGGVPVGKEYILRCRHCGNMKSKKFL